MNACINAYLNQVVEPIKRPTEISLMPLNRGYYFNLSNTELILFSRLAVLTNNGQKPCNYSNEQASLEFGLKTRTIERAIYNLKKFDLISVSRGQNLALKRGYRVRTITLNSPAHTFKKEA